MIEHLASPPYLWVYITYASLTIPFVVVAGVSHALRLAGLPDAARYSLVRSTAVVLFGWLAVAAVLASMGIFRAGLDRPIPFIAFGIGIPIIVGAALIRTSASTRTILAAVPQHLLVGVQCYRGLGVIFLVLHGVGLLPGQFAIPAGFGDVLTALLALPVAALYAAGFKHRNLLVVLWNIFGLVDLVIAVTTGFLTSPTPLQMLAFDQPNNLVGLFPLVMIPIYGVPLSIVFHIASLTKLARERARSRQGALGVAAA